MKTTGELFVEYERLYKEAETAHDIWAAHEEEDSLAFRAFKVWQRAEEKRDNAFQAYRNAVMEEMGAHNIPGAIRVQFL